MAGSEGDQQKPTRSSPGRALLVDPYHKLFSHTSMNWRGRPLSSHEVIVNSIAATTTTTRLTVRAELDTGRYPTGVKIPDKEMKSLETSGMLNRHQWHPEWNYTLKTRDTPTK